ncbi:MAG: ABC transporter permease [Gaiellaceae bacterium]|jgi:lipopolysaccharide transport system permease protein
MEELEQTIRLAAKGSKPMELVIKRERAFKINLRELWSYRELFYFFAWRDIKVRYKQTAIGVVWAVFQPFVTMVVFTVFFNRVAGIKAPDAIPYAIFSYTGLLFWNFFSNALLACSNSMVANQSVITKIYFPRIIAPFSATIVNLVDFLFAFLVYAGLLAYYRIVPGVSGIVLFLPMLLLAFVAATGLGLFLAALNVRYRDVRFIVPFLVNMFLFLTPVIYPVSLVPARYQWILYLNPMTGIIQTVRAGMLHEGMIQWGMLSISLVGAIFAMTGGLFYFKRQERSFADFI